MRALLFILTIFIIFSGCVEESKVTQSNESEHQGSVNTTPENLSSTALSSKEENIPEIEVRSFSSIYTHTNLEKENEYLNKVEVKYGYNITKKYYAVYNLSIKNNGSNDLDFKLNKLHVRDGDHIFNTTIGPESQSSLIEVLSDLEKETKLEDTTLAPGQTINGSVVFQVNSFYNKSFQLMYNEIPIPSASFEESIEALSAAERYNYSAIFGIPPYNENLEHKSFEPDLKKYPYIWATWVNRDVFEVFNKADSEFFNKKVSEYMSDSSENFVPGTETVYALKVIPERNITVKTHFVKKNGLDVSGSPFKVVDDSGEELTNLSQTDKIGILMNQTYELQSADNVDISQMNFSNVYLIRISFMSNINLERMSIVNQNIIVDKELNIVAASNKCMNFIA